MIAMNLHPNHAAVSTKLNAEDLARFWAAVAIAEPDACWLWQGSPDDKGYGLFWSGEHACSMRAHRVSYQLAHGSIPESLVVMHDPCHTPGCCNPAHLILGTHRENMAERNALGRQAFGVRCGSAKLDDDKVRAIRVHLANSEPLKRIARVFGVSATAVRFIRDGKTWAHVAPLELT